jgi:hypothetical protein
MPAAAFYFSVTRSPAKISSPTQERSAPSSLTAPRHRPRGHAWWERTAVIFLVGEKKQLPCVSTAAPSVPRSY